MVRTRRQAVFLITLSIVLALTATVMLLNHLAALETELGETAPVLVAARDIEPHAPITRDMLRTTNIPRRYLHETMLEDPEIVLQSLARIPLSRGDLLTTTVLQPWHEVPENLRNVTLAAGGNVVFDPNIAAGDRVDVIASFREDDQDVTRVMLSGIDVVAASQRGLTLSIDLEQAQRLIWLENYAKQLRVLRRPPR